MLLPMPMAGKAKGNPRRYQWGPTSPPILHQWLGIRFSTLCLRMTMANTRAGLTTGLTHCSVLLHDITASSISHTQGHCHCPRVQRRELRLGDRRYLVWFNHPADPGSLSPFLPKPSAPIVLTTYSKMLCLVNKIATIL